MSRTYNRNTAMPSYMYGSAAPAVAPQSPFEVRRSSRKSVSTQVLPAYAMKLVIVAAVVFTLIACVGIARVQLTVASQDQLIAANELSTEITTVRKNANNLEVQQSYMSNATHIRTAATQLNMAAPETVATITLGADVVATDAAGNLSLAGTLGALAL